MWKSGKLPSLLSLLLCSCVLCVSSGAMASELKEKDPIIPIRRSKLIAWESSSRKLQQQVTTFRSLWESSVIESEILSKRASDMENESTIIQQQWQSLLLEFEALQSDFAQVDQLSQEQKLRLESLLTQLEQLSEDLEKEKADHQAEVARLQAQINIKLIVTGVLSALAGVGAGAVGNAIAK